MTSSQTVVGRRINQNPDALLASGAAAGVAAGVKLRISPISHSSDVVDLGGLRFQCTHCGYFLCFRGKAPAGK